MCIRDRTSIEQRIATGDSLPENHAQRSNQLTVSLHLIQLIDSNGNISDQMALKPEYSIPVDITKLRQIPMGETTHETYLLASGEPLRVATRHARDVDGESYFIRIGGSLGALRSARSRL